MTRWSTQAQMQIAANTRKHAQIHQQGVQMSQHAVLIIPAKIKRIVTITTGRNTAESHSQPFCQQKCEE